MFITAVCVIFLIKLRWPKSKSLYDKVDKSSNIFKSSTLIDLGSEMNIANICSSLCLIGRVRFAWHCGKTTSAIFSPCIELHCIAFSRELSDF